MESRVARRDTARPHLSHRPPAEDAVTYAKHIAPILPRSCQSGDRTGSIVPMSLLTYEEVRPWARSVHQRVVSREMPPWFIDRDNGVQGSKADKSFSDGEIALVSAVWSVTHNGPPLGPSGRSGK